MWHKDDAGMDTLDAEQTWTQSRPGRTVAGEQSGSECKTEPKIAGSNRFSNLVKIIGKDEIRKWESLKI